MGILRKGLCKRFCNETSKKECYNNILEFDAQNKSYIHIRYTINKYRFYRRETS